MKIAIASGKGGTGKTFVATNLFKALKDSGYGVMLVDCDAEAPNALSFFNSQQVDCIEVTQLVPVIDSSKCNFCGKCQEYCSYNAIFLIPSLQIIRVMEDLCHACGACLHACDQGAITEKKLILGQISSYTLNGKIDLVEARTRVGSMTPVPAIKLAIKLINNQVNTVIFDAPPGTSCPFIHTVTEADYVILVTEPTPFGLSDLKRSIEALKQIDKPFGVIVNRAGIGNNEVYQYLDYEGVPLLMEIPFNKQIARMYSNGELVIDNMPLLKQQFLETFEKISK